MNPIITAEHPTLRATAAAIDPADISGAHVQNVIKNMQHALAKERFGVAIAAPQINESIQLFLVSGSIISRIKDGDDATAHPDFICINPQILKTSKKQSVSNEGCLSVPGKYGTKVQRPEKVSIKYYNEKGEQKTYNASGFLAQIFLHEIDHLNGILYTDHALAVIDVDDNMEPIDGEKDTVQRTRKKRLTQKK